jgi:mono/diheme cytochrome c family protein
VDTRVRWVVAVMMVLVAPQAQGETQESTQGASLFYQYCASCHGATGTGNGPMAAYLTVKPTDLTRIAARHGGTFPSETIAHIIAGEEEISGHGSRTMPVWGERLQDDVIGGVNKPAVARGRIAFLVDYLEALQKTGKKEFENIVIPGRGPRPGVGPQP